MEPIELLPSAQEFSPVHDPRPVIAVPPPVKLVAIDDIHLPGASGVERDLDSFYLKILCFERDLTQQGVVYRAENFRLRVRIPQ